MVPKRINQLAQDSLLQARVDDIKVRLGMKPSTSRGIAIKNACEFFRISPAGTPESIVDQLLALLQRYPQVGAPPPPQPPPGIFSPPGHNVSPTSVVWAPPGYSPQQQQQPYPPPGCTVPLSPFSPPYDAQFPSFSMPPAPVWLPRNNSGASSPASSASSPLPPASPVERLAGAVHSLGLSTRRPRKVQEWSTTALLREIEPPSDDRDQRHAVLECVRRVACSVLLSDQIFALTFGSTGCNLHSRDSDLDVALRVPYDQVTDRAKREMIVRLADAFKSNHQMCSVEAVPDARVPIVRLVHAATGIQCDVSIGNEAALHKTALLNVYSQREPLFRELCLLVKHWARKRKLNSPRENTLSSYTWTLLVIHFLQKRQPALLPMIANANLKTFTKKKKAAIGGTGTNQPTSAAKLLYEFFSFFAELDPATYGTISIRVGQIVMHPSQRLMCARMLASPGMLSVEDPVCPEEDLGRVLKPHTQALILRELRRAHQLLSYPSERAMEADKAWERLRMGLWTRMQMWSCGCVWTSKAARLRIGENEAAVIKAEREKVEREKAAEREKRKKQQKRQQLKAKLKAKKGSNGGNKDAEASGDEVSPITVPHDALFSSTMSPSCFVGAGSAVASASDVYKLENGVSELQLE